MENNKTIRQRLEEGLELELKYQKIHYVIENLIANHWEGKKLNVRLERQIKAMLGEAALVNLSINRERFGMSYVYIWNIEGFKDYNNRYQGFIGYSEDVDKYSSAIFSDRDGKHGKYSVERTDKIKELLKTTIPEYIENLIESLNNNLIAYREDIKSALGEFIGTSYLEIGDRIQEICGKDVKV